MQAVVSMEPLLFTHMLVFAYESNLVFRGKIRVFLPHNQQALF